MIPIGKKIITIDNAKINKQLIEAKKIVNENCPIYEEAITFRMMGWPMEQCYDCNPDKCKISVWLSRFDTTIKTGNIQSKQHTQYRSLVLVKNSHHKN